jgi:hypothetical protein
MPVRMPALALRDDDAQTVWNFVAPRASDASRSSRGHGAQRLLRRHDDDGKGEHGHREGGPDEGGLAVDLLAAEERLVDARAHELTKNPRPKRPKTIDGTPARLATAMRMRRVARDWAGAYSWR